jgi:CHAT domain-containing protein/cytochrome c-type biogenesis protein CcmH/NrfG
MNESAWVHLQYCELCQTQVRTQKGTMERLAQLKAAKTTLRGPQCPVGGAWLELAVGIHPDPEILLSHAAGCDYCAPLLQEALTDLTSESTAEDEARIGDLATADPIRQKVLAQGLASGSARVGAELRGRGGFPPIARPRRFGFWSMYAVAATVLVILSSLLALHRLPSSTPQTLLADAYTERRTLELRIPGANHAPIHVERGAGASDLDKPGSLLRAESMIAEGLRKKPGDPELLDAKARADLMDGNFESAIQSLQRALESQVEAPALLADLGTAYFARAEATGQTIDYGRAIDNLGKVLAVAPNDSLALFNRAIAEERLLLYHEAASDWNRFLEVERDPAWREEGQERLKDLQRKIQENQKSRIPPLREPAAAIAALTTGLPDSNSRPAAMDEDYLDVATRDWLYVAGSGKVSGERAGSRIEAQNALKALAERMGERHHDDWLAELVNGPHGIAWEQGSRELAQAFRANAVGDIGGIVTHANHSAALFRSAANEAGVAGADLLYAVGMNRAERGDACLPAANKALAVSSHHGYAWIETKALFALSACQFLGSNAMMADASARRAQQLAQSAGYPVLELDGLYYRDGVVTSWMASAESWGQLHSGLGRFWTASYPPQEAANFYADLGFAAETEAMWHTAERVGDETILMESLDGDVVYLAAAHHWLAEVAESAGDTSLADREYERGAAVLQAATSSEAAKTTLEIERTAFEVRQGKFDLAASRLNAMQSSLKGFSKQYATILYLETAAALQSRLGNPGLARADLQEAIQLIERNRDSLNSDSAIFGWQKTTWEAYRSLVELYAQTYHDADTSFALLEWSRAGPLRAASTALSKPTKELLPLSTSPYSPGTLKLEPGTALLTWMAFSHGLAIWLADTSGVHTAWVDVPQEKLEAAAHTFARLCADPTSDSGLIDQQGSRLYKWLVEPVSPALKNITTIVLEPDTPLNTVPFQALKTTTGEYLGDRLRIIESPGLGYARRLRKDGEVSKNSSILAVGDPLLNTLADKRLRPLPDADKEAHEISRQFPRRSLLTGADATIDNVLASLPQAQVFHFAGHSITEGRESGLLLASRKGDRSVLLGATDLHADVTANLKLAILSACDTATSEQGPEDPASLVLLFLRAGVPKVIASKWPVDSAVSSALMEDFYNRLLKGDAVEVALTGAEQDIRFGVKTSHPYFWAAFSAFGGL